MRLRIAGWVTIHMLLDILEAPSLININNDPCDILTLNIPRKLITIEFIVPETLVK